MGKGIRGPSEGGVAPESKQCGGRGRSRDVAMFPSPGDFRTGNRRTGAEIRAHHYAARTGDKNDRHCTVEKNDFAGLPIRGENGDGGKNVPGNEGPSVLEKRIDQREVNVCRKRFVSLNGSVNSERRTHYIAPSTIVSSSNRTNEYGLMVLLPNECG